MTTAMEQALWRKQKQPVIQGFINEHRQLVSAVAGNGFLQAPGFLYEGESGLEVNAKQKLSGISYAILKEAVDRDLKQYGIDTDAAFKAAQMDWELEKSTLLNDWDKELAWIKKGWAQKDEELDQLSIEVSRRGITLLEAKTAIELEKEELKAQLAGLDDDSADYEVELANKKLLTANKKLEVIPVLYQILSVEESILSAEQKIALKEQILVAAEKNKINYLSELVGAESEIANKKTSDLLPILLRNIQKNRELAEAIEDQIGFERLIMAQKVIDAGIMVEKAENQLLIAESQIEEETARLALLDAKIALADARREYSLALQVKQTQDLRAATITEESAHNTVMNQEGSTQSNFVNLKTETEEERLAQDVDSSLNLTNKHVETTQEIADIGSDERVRVAGLRAVSNITSQLSHLIG